MMAEEYMYKNEEEVVDPVDTVEETEVQDAVNHPIHYESLVGDLHIECIDAMRAAFGEDPVACFCLCNSFKYIWRHTSKGGNQDIKKAIWYLNKYLELGGTTNM